MARQVRTARGDLVDFDEILIKQQLAEAPMNVEVQRRKNFIDSKETVGRQRKVQAVSTNEVNSDLFVTGNVTKRVVIESAPATANDFENTNEGDDSKLKERVEAVPILPERKK